MDEAVEDEPVLLSTSKSSSLTHNSTSTVRNNTTMLIQVSTCKLRFDKLSISCCLSRTLVLCIPLSMRCLPSLTDFAYMGNADVHTFTDLKLAFSTTTYVNQLTIKQILIMTDKDVTQIRIHPEPRHMNLITACLRETHHAIYEQNSQ